MLADYAAIDAVSAEVLRSSAARQGAPVAMPLHPAGPPRRLWHARWMIPAAAVAACLALLVYWQTPPLPAPDNAAGEPGRVADAGQAASSRSDWTLPQVGTPGGDVGVWQVADAPAGELDRVTNRNVIFVTDDEGNIYMINVDHVLELQKPKDRNGLIYTRDPI